MINKIGNVKSVNFEEWKEFLIKYNSDSDFRSETSKKMFQKEDGSGYRKIFVSEDEIFNKNDKKLLIYYISRPFFDKDKEDEVGYYGKEIEERFKPIKKNLNSYNKFGHFPEVKYMDEHVVGFMYSAMEAIIIPKELVEIEFAKEYGTLTQSQIGNLIGNTQEHNSLVLQGDMTYEESKNKLELIKEELRLAEQKQKEELDKIRLEMEKRERDLRKQMEGVLSELNSKIEHFKDVVFVMELNIFALRTFLGETFTINHIRKGKNLDNHPLIIYQKFRYLDEEFARFRALNDYSLDDFDSVSDILEKDESLLNTLAPSEKCITFFRFSKDNKDYFYSKSDDILHHEEYLYGRRLGMIIRNGESVSNTGAVSVDSLKNIRLGYSVGLLDKDGDIERLGTINHVDYNSKCIHFNISFPSSTDRYTKLILIDSYNQEIKGLSHILGDSEYVYGLKREDHNLLRAYKGDIERVDMFSIQKHIDNLKVMGSDINFIYSSVEIANEYMRELVKNKQLVEYIDIGGYKAISYNGIPLISDRFIESDTVYLLNTYDFTLHQLCDWQWLEGEDGKLLDKLLVILHI